MHIPEHWQPVASNDLWALYQPIAPFLAAVHSRPDTGVVALFLEGDEGEVLQQITQANDDENALAHRFQWPGGVTLTYDLAASKDTWVIQSVDGKPTDAKFDGWALMDGHVPVGEPRD